MRRWVGKMSEVVSFPQSSPRIWICDCGCSTFNLREDGVAVCAGCMKEHYDQGGWYTPPADAAVFSGEPYADVQGNGSVEFSHRRVAQLAARKDAVAVVVIRDGGQIHAWHDADTDARKKWVRKHLFDAWKLIRGRE